MLFIFGKKGKPHDSIAATLKTSPETAVDGFVWNWGLLLKIRKEKSGLFKTIAASHKSLSRM